MSALASRACGSPLASSSVRRSVRSAPIPPAPTLTSKPLLPGRHPQLTCRRSSAAFNGVALASTEHRCCWSGTAVAQRRAGAHRGGAVPRRAGLATRGPAVLAILLALAAAVGYGSSDFAAGMAARRASVIRVALMTEAVCVIVAGLVLPLTGAGQPDVRAVAWGMASGLAGVSGALMLYLGFRHAAFSVAGPLSAVAAAGFSVLAGLLLGERPTALADRDRPGAARDRRRLRERPGLRTRAGPGKRAGMGKARSPGLPGTQQAPRGGEPPPAWVTGSPPESALRSCSSGSTRPAPAAACGRCSPGRSRRSPRLPASPRSPVTFVFPRPAAAGWPPPPA